MATHVYAHEHAVHADVHMLCMQTCTSKSGHVCTPVIISAGLGHDEVAAAGEPAARAPRRHPPPAHKACAELEVHHMANGIPRELFTALASCTGAHGRPSRPAATQAKGNPDGHGLLVQA